MKNRGLPYPFPFGRKRGYYSPKNITQVTHDLQRLAVETTGKNRQGGTDGGQKTRNCRSTIKRKEIEKKKTAGQNSRGWGKKQYQIRCDFFKAKHSSRKKIF